MKMVDTSEYYETTEMDHQLKLASHPIAGRYFRKDVPKRKHYIFHICSPILLLANRPITIVKWKHNPAVKVLNLMKEERGYNIKKV